MATSGPLPSVKQPPYLIFVNFGTPQHLLDLQKVRKQVRGGEEEKMYGLKHHIVEISGDVTDAGRTREDCATQLFICTTLIFAFMNMKLMIMMMVMSIIV